MLGRLANEAEAIGDRQSLLGLLAMGVLVLRLAKDHPAVDKKLLRQLLDMHIQASCVPSLASRAYILLHRKGGTCLKACKSIYAWDKGH